MKKAAVHVINGKIKLYKTQPENMIFVRISWKDLLEVIKNIQIKLPLDMHLRVFSAKTEKHFNRVFIK